MSPERLKKIREQLSEPFDPGEIKWRVTATSTQQTKHGPQKRGQLVAYADQRAYTDRLNDVFGEWGWTRSYDVQVAQNFERRAPGDKNANGGLGQGRRRFEGDDSRTWVAHRCRRGVGGRRERGDARRSAGVQARLLRVSASAGICTTSTRSGWISTSTTVRSDTPSLPDWALPGNAKREAATPSESHGSERAPRQSLVREETLAKVRELRDKVGHSLSLFVLEKYAGGADPEKLGHAKLTTVFEKLSDIGNGIDRLRRAAAVSATRVRGDLPGIELRK